MTQATIAVNDGYIESHVGTTPSTGPFAFDFPYWAPSEVKVEIVLDGQHLGTRLVVGIDYTIVGSPAYEDGSFGGGTITLLVAVANSTVRRFRDTRIERLSNFPLEGYFSRLTLNADLNRFTMALQDFQRRLVDLGGADDGSGDPDARLSTYLKVPDVDALLVTTTAAAVAVRGTHLVAWDVLGNLTHTVATMAELEAAIDATTGPAGGDLQGFYPNPTIKPSVLAPYALDTDLNAYLPKTGGTLTGALAGTSITLSGGMTVGIGQRYTFQNRGYIDPLSDGLFGLSNAGATAGVRVDVATTPGTLQVLNNAGGANNATVRAAFGFFDTSVTTAALTANGGPIVVDRTGDAATASVVIAADASRTANVIFQTTVNPRWSISKNATLEGGSNAGSDLAITAHNDAGVVLSTPMTITRSTGSIDLSGPVLSGGPATARWQITGNTLQMFGSGGINSLILQHDNTHAYLRPQNAASFLWLGGAGLNSTFVSSTGFFPATTATMGLGNASNTWGAVWSAAYVANGAAGANRTLFFDTAGVHRWGVRATSDAESTGNLGSAFAIDRYNDAGAYIDTPFTINRATAAASVSGTLTVSAPATANVAIATYGNINGNAYNHLANANAGAAAAAGYGMELSSVANGYALLLVNKAGGLPNLQLSLGAGLTDGFYLPPLTKGTTPAPGTNNTQVATTAFVAAAVSGPAVVLTGTFQAFSPNAGSSSSTISQILPTVVTGNSGGWYSTVNGRYTPPAGRYRICGTMWGYSSGGNMSLQAWIAKNGVSVTANAPAAFTVNANNIATITYECIVDASGTDYFQLQTLTNVAASQSYAMFHAHPVSTT